MPAKCLNARKERKEYKEGNKNTKNKGVNNEGKGNDASKVERLTKISDGVNQSYRRITESTTRVCIKNVPVSFTESKLRQHLISSDNDRNSKTVITDCKILKTKDGKSRKLAFVGFKTPEMAHRVISHFHNSFALTSKITVEAAFSKKEISRTSGQNLLRPWSKYSKGSSRHDHIMKECHEVTSTEENAYVRKKMKNETLTQGRHFRCGKKEEDDKEKKTKHMKKEFVSVVMDDSDVIERAGEKVECEISRNKSKFWSNDDFGFAANKTSAEHNKLGQKEKVDGVMNYDNSPRLDTEGKDRRDCDVESVDTIGEGTDTILNAKNIRGRTNMSDMDFLRSKTVATDNLSDDEDKCEDAVNTHETESGMGSSYSNSLSSSDFSESGDRDTIENQEGEKLNTVNGSLPNTENREFKERVEKLSMSTYSAKHSNLDPAHDRLFVRNLPFSATEHEVHDAFAPYGEILECHIPIDDTKCNKGYAFVKFLNCADATKAMNELDATDFQGRVINVLPAMKGYDEFNDDQKVAEKIDPGDLSTSNSTYKRKQETARQKEASKSTVGLSSSFVRGDAVVDNLADRLGLGKGDILNLKDGLSSGNAAVRIALGETRIIEENRDYFQSHGVDMDVLVSSPSQGKKGIQVRAKSKSINMKRSSTMILVKNLPYDTSQDDVRKLFHGVGSDNPERILLPPSRTIAVVEYNHAANARKAFRKLAYKRFKHVPLYFEWAPLSAKTDSGIRNANVLSNISDDVEINGNKTSVSSLLTNDKEVENNAVDDETAGAGTSHTIFVKNLSFTTTECHLRKTFENIIGKIRAVKIPTRAAPLKKVSDARIASTDRKDFTQLSLGFGFVECHSEDEARKAIKALHGNVLNGHKLDLKLSSKAIGKKIVSTSNYDRKKTKLMVRNVPFEASRTDLLQLFGSFGHLKKVRLPKKFDGGHRGFAFVEFLTGQEALKAFSSLAGTHLYGRHLVLEWAEDKDDVEMQRYKAKRGIENSGINPGLPIEKKIRFD